MAGVGAAIVAVAGAGVGVWELWWSCGELARCVFKVDSVGQSQALQIEAGAVYFKVDSVGQRPGLAD